VVSVKWVMEYSQVRPLLVQRDCGEFLQTKQNAIFS
jgi:hypothetical protein